MLQLELDELLGACQRVAPALGSERPIFGAIRIASANGEVTVAAHNAELHFVAAVTGSPDLQFEPMLVPGEPLIRFLRVLEKTGEQSVELTRDEPGKLLVAAGQTAMTLMLVNSDAWPTVDPRMDGAVVLSDEDLARMRSVLFAASTDVAKGALVGVRISGRTVTGSDNARLAQTTLDVDLEDCLVPAELLKESMRDSSGPVRWIVDGSHAMLRDDRGFWRSVLMTQEFPDGAVRDLLGRRPEAWLTVDADALRVALERVAVLASSRVEVRSADGFATVRVVSREIGEIEATIPSDGTFAGATWIDRRHLVDAIEHHDSRRVHLDFTGPDKPILVAGDRLRQMLVSSSRAD